MLGVRPGLKSATAACTALSDPTIKEQGKSGESSDSDEVEVLEDDDEENAEIDDDDDDVEEEEEEVCVICSMPVAADDSSDTDSSISPAAVRDAEKAWSTAGSAALRLGLSEMCQGHSENIPLTRPSKALLGVDGKGDDAMMQRRARGEGNDEWCESDPSSVHCDWCQQCAHMACVVHVGGFDAQAGFWKCPVCVSNESRGTRRSARNKISETQI